MGMMDPGNIRGDQTNKTLEAFKDTAADTAKENQFEGQVASKASAATVKQPGAAPKSPKKTKTREARGKTVGKALESKGEKGFLPVQKVEQSANKFEQRSKGELKAKSLNALRDDVQSLIAGKDLSDMSDSEIDALKKNIYDTVLNFYKDPSLADDAIDFLLETTEGKLKEVVDGTAQLHRTEDNMRLITAGKNIAEEAREAHKEGLGTPVSMRSMYRDFSGSHKNCITLFNEFANKYDYNSMEKVTKFLLNSIGSDLKSGGPSIEPGRLSDLTKEVRSLQAILGLYNFYKGRMPLLTQRMKESEAAIPKELNFENMTKAFMQLAGQSRCTIDQVLRSVKLLGIKDSDTPSKIIAIEQFRDGIYEVSINQVYKNVPHRDDLKATVLGTLERLYEEEAEEEDYADDYDDDFDLEKFD